MYCTRYLKKHPEVKGQKNVKVLIYVILMIAIQRATEVQEKPFCNSESLGLYGMQQPHINHKIIVSF